MSRLVLIDGRAMCVLRLCGKNIKKLTIDTNCSHAHNTPHTVNYLFIMFRYNYCRVPNYNKVDETTQQQTCVDNSVNLVFQLAIAFIKVNITKMIPKNRVGPFYTVRVQRYASCLLRIDNR